MKFRYIITSLFFVVVSTLTTSIYAAPRSTETPRPTAMAPRPTVVITPKVTETISSDEIAIEENLKKQTEKKAKSIILEVYKAQGNKIIKDIDENLQKANPDPRARSEAYTNIQKTLEVRKQKVIKMDMPQDSKDVVINYIDYMIISMEKKKKSIN